MFVQNAEVFCSLTSDNSELWVENSFVGKRWTLADRHVITGVPVNDWELHVPSGVCIDVVPVGDEGWVARPYGFNDTFKGNTANESTLFMGRAIVEWSAERGINLPACADIQNAALFPVCRSMDELGAVLRWMVSEPYLDEGRKVWEVAEKMSANRLSDCANLRRLFAQREAFRKKNWSMLAANHDKSIFYQLDLADAASEFVAGGIMLPKGLPADAPLMKRVHDHMFRACVLQLSGDERGMVEQQQAFSLLREGLINTIADEKQMPRLNVYRDQIVWGRSPVRIDLAGGWTDTPPYCMYAGGNVVNVAIELNGQPPLQVYVKPTREFRIILRSIDIGAMECISTWDELRDFNKVGSPFSIPKAALALAVLGALSDFCGLAWDKNEIGNRTLILEQLLTTGGGWQDQYGGVLHGLKLLQTGEGFHQNPSVRWLPEYLFTEPEYRVCHLLYYTGITRTAKDILAEIVRGMFLNSGSHLRLLSEMKVHALDMYEAILRGDFASYGRLVGKSWEQNKALDAGTNPPAVERLISRIKDYALGYKLPGAGGGGYLYIVAKDPEASLQIRRLLTADPQNDNARFVEMSLSDKGLQVSRS